MFDSSLFLEIANKLLGDRSYRDEAGWRTAIGRAYYAAFLETMKRLQELGVSFADADRIHRDVIQELMLRNTDLGNRLDKLRQERVKADYFMDATVTSDLGGKCARLSEGITKLVESLG